VLRIVRSVNHLDFTSLMRVYKEGNLEKAEEEYAHLPKEFGLLQAEQDFYQYLRDCFFSTDGAFYCLWSVEDAYVSALRMEPYRDGLLLEALETAPDQRRRGYGEALMRQVLDSLNGEKIYSHVSKTNTASLRLHKKCGFTRISEYAAYIDGSVNSHACTFCYETKK